MRSQKVIEQRLGEVDRQIRGEVETASKEDWDRLHKVSETLRWVLNIPTESTKAPQ